MLFCSVYNGCHHITSHIFHWIYKYGCCAFRALYILSVVCCGLMASISQYSSGFVHLPRGNRMKQPWWIWANYNKAGTIVSPLRHSTCRPYTMYCHINSSRPRDPYMSHRSITKSIDPLNIENKAEFIQKWFRIYGVTRQPSIITVKYELDNADKEEP